MRVFYACHDVFFGGSTKVSVDAKYLLRRGGLGGGQDLTIPLSCENNNYYDSSMNSKQMKK
jgi:hypothetical protein